MQIFEYPYVIVTIFILCFAAVIAVGVHFAIKGMKTANGKDENDFVSLGKLESEYIRAAKARKDRSVAYIGTSFENFYRFGSKELTCTLLGAEDVHLGMAFHVADKAFPNILTLRDDFDMLWSILAYFVV